MKRFVLASVAALAVVTTVGAAHAADIQRRQAMPAKAPVYVQAYNWSGLYLGINGGGGWGTTNWSATTGSNSSRVSGGVIGGTLGYNHQVGQAVFGLEGDIDWSNIRGTTTGAPCTTSCETRNSWMATTRGRIGYAFDRFMPFVTGGAAFGDIKASPAGLPGNTTTKAGWTLGGGGEFAVAGPWTAKVEYLYVDLGKANCPAGSCAVSTDVSLRTSLVRAGLNYRF